MPLTPHKRKFKEVLEEDQCQQAASPRRKPRPTPVPLLYKFIAQLTDESVSCLETCGMPALAWQVEGTLTDTTRFQVPPAWTRPYWVVWVRYENTNILNSDSGTKQEHRQRLSKGIRCIDFVAWNKKLQEPLKQDTPLDDRQLLHQCLSDHGPSFTGRYVNTMQGILEVDLPSYRPLMPLLTLVQGHAEAHAAPPQGPPAILDAAALEAAASLPFAVATWRRGMALWCRLLWEVHCPLLRYLQQVVEARPSPAVNVALIMTHPESLVPVSEEQQSRLSQLLLFVLQVAGIPVAGTFSCVQQYAAATSQLPPNTAALFTCYDEVAEEDATQLVVALLTALCSRLVRRGRGAEAEERLFRAIEEHVLFADVGETTPFGEIARAAGRRNDGPFRGRVEEILGRTRYANAHTWPAVTWSAGSWVQQTRVHASELLVLQRAMDAVVERDTKAEAQAQRARLLTEQLGLNSSDYHFNKDVAGVVDDHRVRLRRSTSEEERRLADQQRNASMQQLRERAPTRSIHDMRSELLPPRILEQQRQAAMRPATAVEIAQRARRRKEKLLQRAKADLYWQTGRYAKEPR